MTTKFLDMNKLSIRPQNDTERLMLGNLGTMIQTGKEAVISFDNDDGKSDLILEIKSKK
jgi:hypothetical protein